MYGARSLSSGRFTATYAAPPSNADASMMLTRPKSGIPLGVTLVQCAPPSRVTYTSPSSDPVQITFVLSLDGPIAKIVPYTSGAFMSCVIGPPDGPMVAGSWRVRSGLIRVHDWPPLVVFHRCCDLAYSRFGFTGEKMIG